MPSTQALREQRREAAKRYRDLLGSTEGIVLPFEPEWSRAIYHLYVVRVQHRQRLQELLEAADIGTGVHYPVPLHLQRAYGSSGYQTGEFPYVEEAAAEIVSLPMFPGLAYEEQRRVAEQIQAFLRTSRHALGAPGK